MTGIARRLIDHLEQSPSPWCDDCLTRDLGLARRQQAQAVTGVLEETPLYDRYRGACGHCKDGAKMVISRKRTAAP